MLDIEKRSLMLDYRRRKVISSLAPPDLPEIAAENESVWRSGHVQCHYRREIMLQLTGRTNVSLNGKVYAAEPGTLLLVNNRESHDGRYFPCSADCSHLWMMLRPDFIHCQGDELTGGIFNVDFRYISRNRTVISELNRWWNAPGTGRLAPEAALLGVLAQIDLLILEIMGESSPFGQLDLSIPAMAVEKAKSFLDQNCGKNSSIAFLARMSGYSTGHFQRLFLHHAGMTVGEYIDRIRCRRYDEMHGFNQMKVIAEELGFSSVSALDNWRRRMYEHSML